MKRLLLLLLPGCGCMFNEDSAVQAGRFLMPDELSVGYGYGRLDGEVPRTSDFDEEMRYASLTWYLMPREVRVVNELPRVWYEPQREPVAPILETDEEGNTIITVPRAAGATITTAIIAAVTYLLRRRMKGAITPETEA